MGWIDSLYMVVSDQEVAPPDAGAGCTGVACPPYLVQVDVEPVSVAEVAACMAAVMVVMDLDVR